MKGRKPKPSAVHEANGSYKKNPQRRRQDEPEPPAGRPSIPERIARNAVAAAAWERVCDMLQEMNVLSQADSFVIEKIAMAEAFIEIAWNDGDIRAFNQLMATLRALLVECGLTPSGRTRVKANVKAEDDENPVEELLAKLRQSN